MKHLSDSLSLYYGGCILHICDYADGSDSNDDIDCCIVLHCSTCNTCCVRLGIERSRVLLADIPLSCNNPDTYTSVIKQYNLLLAKDGDAMQLEK